jgi:hypothetical protein
MQSLTVMTQIGRGCSTPPPCTSSSSYGDRNLPERGGAPVQRSDASEGEKKREELGLVAVVVCVFWERRWGVFIALGGREQGDQRVASTGVLAAFGARSGHGGLGGVLGGCRLGCGRRVVCSGEGRAVGIAQRR